MLFVVCCWLFVVRWSSCYRFVVLAFCRALSIGCLFVVWCLSFVMCCLCAVFACLFVCLLNTRCLFIGVVCGLWFDVCCLVFSVGVALLVV